jgi:RNA polymerase sigma-70 factor (ECF subfamily)
LAVAGVWSEFGGRGCGYGYEDFLELFSFDASYVQRLRDGDGPTEEHFARYFGNLIRIKAGIRMRSRESLEDVRQETLLRVLRNLRKGVIEHPERFGAYVNSVCSNVMLEHFRGDSRWSQFPDEGPELESGESGVESSLLQDERRVMVRQALDELPVKDRQLLHRIFLDEEDKDAVCDEFGVTREHLRVLLHRARGRLRATMRRAEA